MCMVIPLYPITVLAVVYTLYAAGYIHLATLHFHLDTLKSLTKSKGRFLNEFNLLLKLMHY